MYLIEYLSTSANQPPATYTELALGSTAEEARTKPRLICLR